MKIAALLAIFCCAHLASGEVHSFKAFYKATTGINDFPEFVSLNYLDNEVMGYFDSRTKRFESKQSWMAGTLGQQYEERQANILIGWIGWFTGNLPVVMNRFNQTGGLHTLQLMYGCQWDDETQAIDGFRQYGYDGEDFIAFDLKNLRFIAPTPESLITKNKWDRDQGLLEQWKHYHTQYCIDYLKKYVQYGSSTLGRKVAPEVSLLQKGSGVVCHATGFYPEGVMIAWKKDGEEMQDDVDVGETLPNEDGTFQKRAVLTVSPEERKKGQYSCEITHKSGGPIVKILDEDELRRTIPNPGSVPPVVIIGVVVGLLVLIALIGGAVFWKYKKPGKGFVPASTGEGSSHSSNEA